MGLCSLCNCRKSAESMNDQDAAWRVVRAMLGPLVRFCIRHSFPLQEFMDAAKVQYIEGAKAELESAGMEVNNSRISVMTGVQRNMVARILKRGTEEKPREKPLSTVWQVIRTWEQDSRFHGKNRKPRILTHKGRDSEFRELVETVTKHTDPGTILFELERANAVKIVDDGVKLFEGIVRVGDNTEFGYNLLADDMGRLIASIEENLSIPRISNVHITTNYDRIIVKDIPKIRRWLLEESKAFHKKVRGFLASHEADQGTSTAANDDEVGWASFCSFSVTSDLPDEIEDKYLRPDQRSDAKSNTKQAEST